MATTMKVTIAMATLPVYMLVTRGSGAEVNLRLEDDISLGSRVNSFTILLVSSSVLLVVGAVFCDVSDDVVGDVLHIDVGAIVTAAVAIW